MSEQATPSGEQQDATLSLEDIYKEAGVSEASPQTQAVPSPASATPVSAPAVAAAATPPSTVIPDPYDQDAYRAFMANLVQNQTALNTSLQEFRGKQNQIEQQTAQQKLEEDISSATDYLSKESGIENTALAHFELNERARTDVRFRQLWESRNITPQKQAAFQKALSVISKEIGKKYEVRADPTLVANRRALKASQQSSATTDDSSEAGGQFAKLGQATGIDFDREWNAIVRQNN